MSTEEADPLRPLVEDVAALHRQGRLAEAVALMREVVRRRLPVRDPLDSANLGFLLQETWDAAPRPDTLREAITLASHGLDAFAEDAEELARRRERLRHSWRLLHGTADGPEVLRGLPYVPGLLGPHGGDPARTGRGEAGHQELLHHREILRVLHSLTGDLDVLTDHVDVCRAARARAGGEPEEREGDAVMLALALNDLHTATGDPAARDEAVPLLTGLHAGVADPQLRAMYAGLLAPLLDAESADTGDPAGTEQAVELLRRAVAEAAPEHVGPLNRSLGGVLAGLARRTGAYAPLPEAVEAFRAALPALAPDERPACAAALAATLMHAGIRAQSKEQVDEAVAIARAEAARSPHPPSVEGSLWHTLLRSVDDTPFTAAHCLDLAGLARAALAHPGDDALTARRWDRLGRILAKAARLTGDPRHREEAVTAGRNALRLLPPGAERAPFEANLAHALLDAGTLRRDLAVLSEAAALLRSALSAFAPDDPDRPRMRGDLAGVLLTMNELEPDPELLAEALGHARAAAEHAEAADTPADPLLTLAGALHQRAEQHGDPQATTLALTHYQQALALPLDPIRRAAVLTNYAWLLRLRAERSTAASTAAAARAARPRRPRDGRRTGRAHGRCHRRRGGRGPWGCRSRRTRCDG